MVLDLARYATRRRPVRARNRGRLAAAHAVDVVACLDSVDAIDGVVEDELLSFAALRSRHFLQGALVLADATLAPLLNRRRKRVREARRRVLGVEDLPVDLVWIFDRRAVAAEHDPEEKGDGGHDARRWHGDEDTASLAGEKRGASKAFKGPSFASMPRSSRVCGSAIGPARPSPSSLGALWIRKDPQFGRRPNLEARPFGGRGRTTCADRNRRARPS